MAWYDPVRRNKTSCYSLAIITILRHLKSGRCIFSAVGLPVVMRLKHSRNWKNIWKRILTPSFCRQLSACLCSKHLSSTSPGSPQPKERVYTATLWCRMAAWRRRRRHRRPRAGLGLWLRCLSSEACPRSRSGAVRLMSPGVLRKCRRPERGMSNDVTLQMEA
jgi:hypothetical protein